MGGGVDRREIADGHVPAQLLHQRALVEFGSLAIAADDLDVLLQRAASWMAEGLGISKAKVMRYRPATEDLLIVAGVGWREGVVGSETLPTDGSSAPGRALRTSQAVSIQDIRDQSEFVPAPVLVEHGVITLLNVPIRTDGTVWGVLEVDGNRPRQFDEEAELFLKGFANLLGAAIRRIESESNLRSVIDLAPSLLWRSDVSGRDNWFNRRWVDYTGLAIKAAGGEGWLDSVHPDDLESTRAAHRRAVETGHEQEYEQRIRGADGSYRWFLVRVRPVRDPVTKQPRYFGAAIDIHDIKLAQEARLASEHRFRVLAELSPDGILINVDTVFVYANPAVLKILGAGAPEDILGRSPFEIIPADFHEQAQNRIRRVLAGLDNPVAEVEFRRHDGTLLVVETSAVPVTWEGRPAIQVLIRDMTERRRAQEALRRSEERLRRALEIDTVGVVFHDRSGQITETNAAFLKFSGYSRDDVAAGLLNWNKLTPGEHAPAFLRASEQLWSTGRATPYEKECFRKDGSRWWALIAALMLREEESVEFILDITDRKRADKALLEARDEALRAQVTAEEAVCAKSRFLATVSHDLRQPVMAASLFLNLLRKSDIGPDAQDLAGSLTEALDGLSRMLNSLLEVARLEAGIVEARVQDFQLDDLLSRLFAEFQGVAQEAGLQLHVSSSPWRVRTDGILVEMVLRNLISNAIKYTPSGGVVVETRADVGSVVVDVMDTGIGIAETDLDRIFEYYFQSGETSREHPRGFGIGLATVRRVADLLGTSIKVRSVVGRGSTFTFSLPLASGEQAAAIPRASIGTASLAGRSVLVVDDDPLVLKGLEMVLRNLGMHVLAAQNLEQVSKHLDLSDTAPDLVLADHTLSRGEHGREAVDLVRARGPTIAVLITGDTSPERLTEAERSGCRLVHKPISPDDLESLLRELLAAAN
jgi:PAS domain S-box-containing protein